jgi:ABC-type antimicrobial peptide transport system permease subunit
MARKYFGDEDPMGKILNLLQDFKVTGVIKNIPENSHLHFDCIFPIVNMELYWDENFENWRRVQFYTYVQLQKTSPVRDVNQKISHTIKEYLPKYNTQIFLQSLKDIHLRSDYEWDLDNYKKGNMALVYIFSFTALCILMIACINFMNLSTARSANRTKEVGMRKVTGALRRDIIKQFFGETLLLCFIALLVALILVEIFLPAMNSLSGKQLLLNFSGNMNLILGLIAITLFTGILSGSYPALYLSAFQPVNIFKKHFRAKQTKGISLRKLLVVLQFTLTVILIIGTTVVYKQIHYMLQRDLGFNKGHVLIFGLRHFNQETFTNELLQNPNILSITYSQAPDSQPPGISGFDWEGKNPEEELMLYPVVADYDYLKTFDMEMVQGRFFSREHTTDAASAFVVNETASNAMGLENPVGTRLSFRDFRMEFDGTIIGVMKDFHQSSLHNTIEPLVFYIPREGYHRVCVKISSNNVPETLAFIETIWKKYTTDYPINYEFLDEKINSFYKTEQTIGQIFQYFTSLAIIIACLGLFSLASFSAEQRTKEIGIRKVLGASVSGIVIMLTKEFTKWIIIATIIACPVAYLVIQKWLQTFSYRISLGLEIFIFSGALALVIALFTVSYQAIRAARANPVDSLRYE